MIVSIHLPKTAGMSFAELLDREFGTRLLRDYEDFSGFRSADAEAQCAANRLRARERRDELLASYDVIHGHFVADKYVGLFPGERFVAFFRDPYQQVMSHYRFLVRNGHIQHPVVKAFHDAKMTLTEFVAWQGTRNPQTMFLGRLALEDLAMIGLREEFQRSLAVFRAVFGSGLAGDVVTNTDPTRGARDHEIDTDLRKAIAVHYAADIDLYQRALELFARQSGRLGI